MYQETIKILNSMRTAVDECAHHQKFTKRVRDHIRSFLDEYTVSISVEGTGVRQFAATRYNIRVWTGGACCRHSPIITYEGAVHVTWSSKNDLEWYNDCMRAIDITDPSDYMERELQEQSLSGLIAQREKEITQLSAQIEMLRDGVHRRIAALPVPTSAKVRKDPSHWNSPSQALVAQFPITFGK